MTATMAEPPDGTLVGLFDPSGRDLPVVFERDDTDTDDPEIGGRRWLCTDGSSAMTWADVLAYAADEGWQVVRLYRADDPAYADPFRAGVIAAAKAIEAHAESIGWYEGGGVWADAIEEARKAVNV